MIKPNELRIGNFVKTITDKTVIIKEITEGSFNGTVRVQDLSHYDEDVLFGYGCSEISGIELSSDILIKSGFELIKRSFVRDKFKIFALSCINPSFCIKCGGQYLKIAEIKYVHQLQNIYFALVGTELNITL